MKQGGAIIIVIPTTGGPRKIVGIVHRPKLPNSYVDTTGDFRPLDISDGYNDLVGPKGPLRRKIDLQKGPFQLTLDGSFEHGRSWELPVALAHWACGKGHKITAGDASILIWATGALGAYLDIQKQDYHIGRKLKLSLDIIREYSGKGAGIKFFIPEGCGGAFREIAKKELDGINFEFLEVSSFGKVVKSLNGGEKPKLSVRRFPMAVAVGALVLSGLGAGWLLLSPTGVEQETVTAGKSVSTKVKEVITVEKKPLRIRLALIERRAGAGSNCARVVMRGEATVNDDFAAKGNRFPQSAAKGLCGLGFRLLEAPGPVSIRLGDELKSFLASGTAHAMLTLDGKPWEFKLRMLPKKGVSYSLQAVTRGDNKGRITSKTYHHEIR